MNNELFRNAHDATDEDKKYSMEEKDKETRKRT